jgi:hypothetical protein
MTRLYRWVFIVALLISLPASFGAMWVVFVWVLAPLGVIAGLTRRVTEQDTFFLLAALAFVVASDAAGSYLLAIPAIGINVSGFLDGVRVFVSCMLTVVAFKVLCARNVRGSRQVDGGRDAAP